MSDMRITDEGDLDLTDAQAYIVDGDSAIRQHLLMRYRTFLGESDYDKSAGCPWLEQILGQFSTLETVEFVLIDYGERTPGIVPGSMVLALDYDGATRALSVAGKAQADETLVDFTLDVGVQPS